MSGIDSSKRYRILEPVAATLITGRRVSLSPGVVDVQTMASGERVQYVEGEGQFVLVQGEFKRLAEHGRVRPV